MGLPDEFVRPNIHVDPLLDITLPKDVDVWLVPNIPSNMLWVHLRCNIRHELLDELVVSFPVATIARPGAGLTRMICSPEIMNVDMVVCPYSATGLVVCQGRLEARLIGL